MVIAVLFVIAYVICTLYYGGEFDWILKRK